MEWEIENKQNQLHIIQKVNDDVCCGIVVGNVKYVCINLNAPVKIVWNNL